jgi:hypothetical protein
VTSLCISAQRALAFHLEPQGAMGICSSHIFRKTENIKFERKNAKYDIKTYNYFKKYVAA